MGARLSQPKGLAGMGEASVPSNPGAPPSPKRPFPRTINSRTIVAPAAAFTMACLLFVYARTSIRAAKTNAQRHREADSGGEGLSLLAESRRRHSMAKNLEKGNSTVTELGSALKDQFVGPKRTDATGEAEKAERAKSAEDDRLKALKGREAIRLVRAPSNVLKSDSSLDSSERKRTCPGTGQWAYHQPDWLHLVLMAKHSRAKTKGTVLHDNPPPSTLPAGFTAKNAALMIERDTRLLMQYFVARRLDAPFVREHTHPDMLTDIEDMGLTKDAGAHLAYMQSIALANPDWKVEIENSCASVDEEAGRGEAFLACVVRNAVQKGFSEVTREAVYLMEWKRVKGKWVVTAQRLIRGSGQMFQ